MKWNLSSKYTEPLWSCSLQLFLLFLSTPNFKRIERKSSRLSTNNRENQKLQGYQKPTPYLQKWEVFPVPKCSLLTPKQGQQSRGHLIISNFRVVWKMLRHWVPPWVTRFMPFEVGLEEQWRKKRRRSVRGNGCVAQCSLLLSDTWQCSLVQIGWL